MYSVIFALIGFILLIYFFGKDLQNRWFAFMFSKLTLVDNERYTKIKHEVFEPIHSHISNDHLQKIKNLCILEVGVGTGVNFKYYPDGTHLIVVDPNSHFKMYYNENRKKFPNIQSEEIIVCKGEDMEMVESGSVDIVVMTLVLCTVKDIPAVMKQIHRVLAPGGKYIFMEHIKEFSDVHPIRRMLQTCLTVTGVWPLILDGCELTKDVLTDIQSAGFSRVEAQRIHVPARQWALQVISPHLVGHAIK